MFEFLTIGVIALLAAISPGPDFVVVANQALQHHRASAIMTSLGIGLGILIHATYCVLGIAVLIKHLPWLYNAIRYLGAAYLVYLGLKSLLMKAQEPALSAHGKHTISHWQSFKTGLLTNVLNPKCTLFMLSIFTVAIAPGTSLFVRSLLGLEIVLITIGWFVALTLLLTSKLLKSGVGRFQQIVRYVSGVILIALGISIGIHP